jgi:hypothetical protein
MSDGLAHELTLEMSRRELYRCEDPEILREVALQLINLVEGQRDMFLRLIEKHEPGLEPG